MPLIALILVAASAIVLAALMLLFGLTGAAALAVPLALGSAVEDRTGFVVENASLRLDPISLNTSLTRTDVYNPEDWSEAGFIELRELTIDVSPRTFTEDRIRIDRVVIDFGELVLVTQEDGKTNARVFLEKLGLPRVAEVIPEADPILADTGNGSTEGEGVTLDEWETDAPYLIDEVILRLDQIRVVDLRRGRGGEAIHAIGLDLRQTDVTDIEAALKPLEEAVSQVGGGDLLQAAGELMDTLQLPGYLPSEVTEQLLARIRKSLTLAGEEVGEAIGQVERRVREEIDERQSRRSPDDPVEPTEDPNEPTEESTPEEDPIPEPA